MMQPRPALSCFLALLGLVLAANACSGDQTPAAQALDDARIEAARKVARGFAEALQGALRGAITESGPVAAIDICSTRAPALAAAAATDEFTVRRVGTRVRNKRTNAPRPEDRAVLDRFAAMPPQQRAQAHEVRTVDGRLTVYLPIAIGDPVCLTCHGPRDQIPPDVRQKLGELYADDEATGYALGELRGAFVVEAKR